MPTRNIASNFPAWSQTLLLSLLFVAALTASATDTPDSKVIEGAWAPVKAEMGGQPLDTAVLKTISLKLHDGNYDVSVAGQPDKGIYTIDASTLPKSMAITGTDGPNKGRTFPAIYELRDGALRICYDLSGKERPREFRTQPGTRLYLVTYSRQKE